MFTKTKNLCKQVLLASETENLHKQVWLAYKTKSMKASYLLIKQKTMQVWLAYETENLCKQVNRKPTQASLTCQKTEHLCKQVWLADETKSIAYKQKTYAILTCL